MSYGKKQSSQKTREPYGKVSEVGQVPIALQEIKELAEMRTAPNVTSDYQLRTIGILVNSIIAVTCANPGCLSQMAERSQSQMEVQS